MAWDVDRDGWQSVQVDRRCPRLGPDGVATGPRFAPRDMPGATPQRSSRVAEVWPFRVHAPAIAGLWTVHVRVEEIDADTCLLHIAAETPQMVAFLQTVLDAEFVVESPPRYAGWQSGISAPRRQDRDSPLHVNIDGADRVTAPGNVQGAALQPPTKDRGILSS